MAKPSRRRKRSRTPLTAACVALISLLALSALPEGSALAKPGPGARIGVAAQRTFGKAPTCRKLATAATRRTRLLQVQRRKRCLRERDREATASSASSSLYWGAWLGDQITGTEAPWDMNAVSKFEATTGKPMSLVHFAAPFADCSASPCKYYQFPDESMESIRQHGAIPFFSWSSQSTPSSLNEPDFQLSDLIAGTYDSYIRGFAREAAAWGHPFFLRFNWEMNGNWFPWSEGVNGNKAGEYVAAWQHVHDIFTAAGATNATWTWCPNVDSAGKLADLTTLYPGDEYVDWTSLDGYNWGAYPERPSGWTSFKDLFGPTYHRIVDALAASKPMIVGEVGSSEYGGSKSAWIADMLKQLPTEFPKIRGLLWFDKYVDGDWPIETSSAATSAFASGVQSPAYVGNNYASLGAGPVQPPS